MKQIIVRHGKVVLVVLAALVCAVGFGAGVASAQNAHFVNADYVCDQSTGQLLFSWKEAGLGTNQNIDYEFGASNATVTCTCVTNSGKCPAAANKVTFSAPALRAATFNSGKNGSITQKNRIVTAPPCPSSAPPTCGGGQTFRLSEVTYNDIHLTDLTNNVDAGLTPTSCGPITFFTCP
jgi:hypothetical protein